MNTTQDVGTTAVPPEPDRPHILVVDDDPEVRNVLERLLERRDMRVTLSGDGEAALEAVAGSDPDLVLLDVAMPGISGLDVLRRLKADPATRLLPVILITGLDAREDRIRGIEAGADDFIPKPFDQAELLARVRSLVRMKQYTDELDRAESVLLALARAVEERDPYTGGHCDRMAAMSRELGERLDLSSRQIRDLERAASLHDIGKITVPDAVLQKTGPLTPDERQAMDAHPEVGERICGDLRSLQDVLPIIRHHHERLDGSGYPDGLQGDEIPYTARVLQIVDVYDALTTDRPYRRALPPAEALRIMSHEVERGWWDPEIFDEFAAMIREATEEAEGLVEGSQPLS